MSNVYVVQKQMRWDTQLQELVPKYDFRDAERFGALRYLLGPTANPFNPDPLIDDIHKHLDGYTADDYLLLVGNPCLIGWTVAIAADLADGVVQVLQWHGRDATYRAIKVALWPDEPI